MCKFGHLAIELTPFKESEVDEYWINAMREEQNEFDRNQVWQPRPNKILLLVLGFSK